MPVASDAVDLAPLDAEAVHRLVREYVDGDALEAAFPEVLERSGRDGSALRSEGEARAAELGIAVGLRPVS